MAPHCDVNAGISEGEIVVNVLAAWVGLSLPLSMAVGSLLKHQLAGIAETGPAPTYEELFRRAFGGQSPTLAPMPVDGVAQTVQLCMN